MPTAEKVSDGRSLIQRFKANVFSPGRTHPVFAENMGFSSDQYTQKPGCEFPVPLGLFVKVFSPRQVAGKTPDMNVVSIPSVAF